MISFVIFWISLCLIIYHYLFFPILTIVLAYIRNRAVNKGDFFPKVSLIIAAYNEEKIIEKKIRNTFELEYPRDLMEIIIVSDGSTDNTPDIVRKFENEGVVGLFDPPRRGKTAALNRAVEVATGDIIVFSDANSMYDQKAIIKLVRNFWDSSVGGVSGRKSIIKNPNRESSKGDSIFWEIESFLKTKQSLIGSITTADGEIFAIRKQLFSRIPEFIINDDTAITLDIIRKGYRVVYEPEAISKEEASIVLRDDFNVKVRMVCGGYQTLSMNKDILFPPKNFFALQFLSHKVLRWSMPILLCALLVSNFFLSQSPYLQNPYSRFLGMQFLFYFFAFWGFILKKQLRCASILFLPLYYCSMNLAALIGLLAFLSGRCDVSIWRKVER